MGHLDAYRPSFAHLSIAHRNATPRTQHYQQPGIMRTSAGDLIIYTALDDNPTSDEDLVDGTKSRLLRSENDGDSWTAGSDITGYSIVPFSIGDSDLYAFCLTAEWGSVQIRKSTDDGLTWGTATTLLTANASNFYYCVAPGPLVTSGRVYMPILNSPNISGFFTNGVRLSLLHAATSSDLTQSTNWTQSNTVSVTGQSGQYGLWEPNILFDENGDCRIVCRYASNQWVLDKCVIVTATLGGSASLALDGLFDFPGGAHYFTVRRDPVTNDFIAIVNRNTAGNASQGPWAQRTILSLIRSASIEGPWTVVADLVRSPDFGNPHRYEEEGYQYCDWIFEGDDLLCSIRVGEFGIALNYHQASAMYFLRIKDYYRNLLAPAPANSGVSPSSPYAAATRNGRAA